jgi:hypothetical protein
MMSLSLLMSVLASALGEVLDVGRLDRGSKRSDVSLTLIKEL